ncbi:putative methyltransferase-like protein [Cyphellophora attinorum]|uniref:Putative methyltransferase-like protein n=1 Tax=Cyphellophora attinorum TaxID=1664694 RepID=A0A0N1H8S0_9EURO|nr:putative methyltransferase-like protein [Phialophora attinorum]KPI39634.1 putative methyltransferase-like protein [Phialophora attinorum]
MTTFQLHNEAQTGFKSAEAYDTGRPSYAPEVVDSLLKHLEVEGVKNAKILDLAAGTGKFTEALAARSEEYEIVAVEPHDDMRAQLSKKSLKNVTVLKGNAENMEGVSDATFDAVIAAQSFHWFATMEALREIARVLKPAKTLGLIWNIDDYNAPQSWDIAAGWDSEMRDQVWELDFDQPRFRHGQWKKVFDEQSTSNLFTLKFADPLFGLPIGEETVPYKVWLTREAAWERMRTLGQIAVLEGDELARVKARCEKAFDLSGTETDGDKIALHGRTVIAWTSHIPEVPLRSEEAM